MDAALNSIQEEVLALVIHETGTRADCIRPQTTLFGDMGVDGDDGIELLRQFERKFGVDMTACRPNRHFGPEGFAPWAPLYWSLLAPMVRQHVGSRTVIDGRHLIASRMPDVLDVGLSKAVRNRR